MEEKITILKGIRFAVYFKIETTLWEQEGGVVELRVGNRREIAGSVYSMNGSPLMQITTNRKESLTSYILEIMRCLATGEKLPQEVPGPKDPSKSSRDYLEYIDLEFWSADEQWYAKRNTEQCRDQLKAFLDEVILILQNECPLELDGELPE